jgi:hypothetical protein
VAGGEVVRDLAYWVPYSLFHYSRRQIRWVIDNEGCFDAGCWPQEPPGEYLTDKLEKDEHGKMCWIDWIGCGSISVQQGKPPERSEAPFCKTLDIYTDVLNRIESCDTDGKLLLAQLRASYDYLDKEANDALAYVSGSKAKSMKYRDWLKQRNYRESPQIPAK